MLTYVNIYRSLKKLPNTEFKMVVTGGSSGERVVGSGSTERFGCVGILCFLSLAGYSLYPLGAKYFILKLRGEKHELASEEKGRKG